METAVLMMAYGGPNSLDDVEPYLLDVRGGRPTAPELVAEIRERYAAIGGRSPLLEITQAQAGALEERLNREPGNHYRVYVGMRHWHPYIREAVAQIAQDGLRQIVALCMAPQYSRMSIGAYFQKLDDAQKPLDTSLDVIKIQDWHDNPSFIGALAQKVQAGLERFPAEIRSHVMVLFTAHSLPAAIVQQGDPYDAQVRETADLVAARLGLVRAGTGEGTPYRFCYQSAGAQGANWLGPAIEDVVIDLIDNGWKDILVAPVGFVADHVETLFDVDIEARQLANERGARLERVEAQNTSPAFIDALADVVVSRLKVGS